MSIKYKSSRSVKEAAFLHAGLQAYNAEHCAYFAMSHPREKKFGFYAYDSETKIGGICGPIDPEKWVFITELYITDEYRGRNIGTELIRMAENFAKKNQCDGIKTETWDFQAKGFYEKMGFSVFGTLPDHPVGAIDYFLKKKL